MYYRYFPPTPTSPSCRRYRYVMANTHGASIVLLVSTVIAVTIITGTTRSVRLSPVVDAAPLSEEDRLREYHERGYQWPPKFVPDTRGWGDLMARRLDQVARVADRRDRYNGYRSVITSAVVAPNFTENGWGLTRAPEGLVEDLRKSLRDGLAQGPRMEEGTEGVISGQEPLFVDQPELNRRALYELLPLHEAWIGKKLVPATAYGLRVYRNQSSLLMHVDKPRTHIISCILHVDHDEDSDPWPIVIEDFQGNTNEVVLESGDMLFYESSKCLHGRPRKFNGEWYSSIFVHYFPTWWDADAREMESHYAVPPHWVHQVPPQEGLERLRIVTTTMDEPECEDSWCALQKSIKWSGPAIADVVITTGYSETAAGNGKPAVVPHDESSVETEL